MTDPKRKTYEETDHCTRETLFFVWTAVHRLLISNLRLPLMASPFTKLFALGQTLETNGEETLNALNNKRLAHQQFMPSTTEQSSTRSRVTMTLRSSHLLAGALGHSQLGDGMSCNERGPKASYGNLGPHCIQFQASRAKRGCRYGPVCFTAPDMASTKLRRHYQPRQSPISSFEGANLPV